jgi:hypothetical protein
VKRALVLVLAVLAGCGGAAEGTEDESCLRGGCSQPAPAVVTEIPLVETVQGSGCEPVLFVYDLTPQLADATECTVETLPGGDWRADCKDVVDWWCRSRVTIGLGSTGAREVRTCDGFVERECVWSRGQLQRGEPIEREEPEPDCDDGRPGCAPGSL